MINFKKPFFVLLCCITLVLGLALIGCGETEETTVTPSNPSNPNTPTVTYIPAIQLPGVKTSGLRYEYQAGYPYDSSKYRNQEILYPTGTEGLKFELVGGGVRVTKGTAVPADDAYAALHGVQVGEIYIPDVWRPSGPTGSGPYYPITQIGSGSDSPITTFQGITDLTIVRIPKFIQDIGGEAFMGCTKLARVVLAGAYSYSESYTSSLVNIYSKAFSGCILLQGTSSEINGTYVPNTGFITPLTLTRISREAFKGDVKLTSILVRGRVSILGEGVFSGLTAGGANTTITIGRTAADASTNSGWMGWSTDLNSPTFVIYDPGQY